MVIDWQAARCSLIYLDIRLATQNAKAKLVDLKKLSSKDAAR